MMRTPIRRKRPGNPRRGRIIDGDFITWGHEHLCCLLAGKGNVDGDGCRGRLTFHHVRTLGSPKDDRSGLFLCEAHHLVGSGAFSIEAMGKSKWSAYWGVDIPAAVRRYNELYERSNR